PRQRRGERHQEDSPVVAQARLTSWLRHGERDKQKGQGTRDKGQGTRDKGQGTREKGQGKRLGAGRRQRLSIVDSISSGSHPPFSLLPFPLSLLLVPFPFLESVALEPPVQSAAAQAERFRGLADVAVKAGHGLFNQEALDVFEAH